MIQVIWGSAGWGCVVWGGSGGGRVGDILNLGPLDSGVGYGFPLWFEVFGKIGSPRFPNAPHTLTFGCTFSRGRGSFRKSVPYPPLYLPMVCRSSYFVQLPILRKRRAIEVIEVSGPVWGLIFVRF